MSSNEVHGAVALDDTPPPSGSVANTKNQTIVDTIRAPRLHYVTYMDFLRFRKARENYEPEVDENNKEPGVHIQKSSYLISTDATVLELLVDRRYIDRDSVNEVTEEDIFECTSKRCERSKGDYELPDVEKAIRNVRMKMSITGAEPRIDNLWLDYKRALESAGYPSFPYGCPKIAIGHIYDKLRPPLLKEMMAEEFEKPDAKGLQKKDFVYFIKEVVRVAQDVERTCFRRPAFHSVSAASYGKQHHNLGKNKTKKRHDLAKGTRRDKVTIEGRAASENCKRGRDAPLCPHPDCKAKGECHYVKYCPFLKDNEELRNKLLQEWRKENGKERKKRSRNMKSMAAKDYENHSTLFRSKFLQSVEAEVLADNCADDNLMPPAIFESIRNTVPGLEVKPLREPMEYHLAIEARGENGSAKVVCDRLVTMDVELYI